LTDLDIKRRATELLQKGRLTEAAEEYQALLAQSKKPNPAILNLVGDIYVKQEAFEKAFDAFGRAARAYSEEGLFHNAIAVGKKILRFDREQTDVYGMLGGLYARQGLGMDAIKYLNEFARRKEEAGEYPAALAAFADASERLESCAEIHVVHGEMLERVNRAEDASDCYMRAAQAFGDRGRMDLSAKMKVRANQLRRTTTEDDSEEISGIMGLRDLQEGEATPRETKTPILKRPGPTPPAADPESRKSKSFLGRAIFLDPARSESVAQKLSDAAAAAGAQESGAPWRPYNPANHPNLPKPPPLPPRGKSAPSTPSVPSKSAPSEERILPPEWRASERRPPSREIVWDLPPLSLEDDVKVEKEADPKEMVSSIGADQQLGGIRDLTSPDASKLRDYFDEPPAPVEQAVVIGDDLELVREGGDVFEVIADFRDATREILDLDDHQAHYDLGTTYLEMELFDEAIAEFEIAARGEAFALPSQEMLGYCFLRKGQIDLAIRELERALAFPGYDDRDRLGIHYNLGIACGVTDREADAIEHFQRILEIDPNFRDTRSRLERLVQNSH
jgi:tetratricopeptide (TPR) repeat protein